MKIWNYESDETDKLSKLVEKDNSIVMTKPDMAKYLISISDLRIGDLVMEPCLGNGSFYDNLPNYTTNLFCEINLGKDYLDFNGQVDVTLSNPPFVPRKLFWSFHMKAIQTTRRKVYWLISLSSLDVFTPNRIQLMNDMGWYMTNIHIVSDKRWFGRYAWISFEKDPSKNILNFTKKLF